jgi:hypothetical protein
MEWRRKRFGFDPANYFYTLAQQAMLTIPKSTEPGARLNNLNSAIRYLDRAFGWEISYIERAKKDPLFSTLQEYEPYKVVTGKHGVEK